MTYLLCIDRRVAALDIPIPFSPVAEDYTIPNEKKISNEVKKLLNKD